MLPQARLLAKLAAMPAVTAIVGAKRYPMVVPQGVKYPALCFQVLENSPENSADGATKTFHCVLRLAAISPTSEGLQAYTACWRLAATCIGDSDPTAPSGVSGWTHDEASLCCCRTIRRDGQIVAGQDVFDAFVVNELYEVFYELPDPAA